ncbi:MULTISPECIES: NRAMP family divalent metal transporter [Nocardiopsidaceae]|uniref:Divalent metal cation transporter n=1 Tax=Streptomonospora nanhaiensis TaxID=1323731 RepID=A0ABY6YQN8_9ACTN|nr:NRAMP family divalent metal transporter [Streptomonospora nanhaiensis]WAE74699.1 divalent metal cation transporter [Streptomonospora nanhaiensis]
MGDMPPAPPKVRPRLGRITVSSTLLGAMFLMATSAIGPGFITQTTTFTAQLGATFAFAILLSILVDIAVQLNIWRVIGVADMRAQDLANKVLPGAGYLLAALIVFGGLIFNVGNLAGTGLGLDAMLGFDPRIGAVLSALLAVVILGVKKLGVALDRILIVLGVGMIALTLYVAIVSRPPVGEALRQSVMPDQLGTDVFLAAVTIIGGTVGGYITYAGVHRLVEAGQGGQENAGAITKTSVTGIIVTGVMRVLLFLAILGVVSGGAAIMEAPNPSAEAFYQAAGEVGMRLFGMIMWAAAVSSVIGASYTSISFVTTFHPWLEKRRGVLVTVFIGISLAIFLLSGQAPNTLLILAGALNGVILPVGLGIMLWVAARRSHDLLGGYRYPRWLIAIGAAAWLLTVYMAVNSLGGIAALWQ